MVSGWLRTKCKANSESAYPHRYHGIEMVPVKLLVSIFNVHNTFI